MAHTDDSDIRPKSLVGWWLALAVVAVFAVLFWVAFDPEGFNSFCDWWLSPKWPVINWPTL